MSSPWRVVSEPVSHAVSAMCTGRTGLEALGWEYSSTRLVLVRVFGATLVLFRDFVRFPCLSWSLQTRYEGKVCDGLSCFASFLRIPLESAAPPATRR